jgi:alpha-mannosidase
MSFCARPAQAQNRDPLSALSAESHRTIAQLSSLNAIPASDWKFHVGDVAHGEAPQMDD